MVNLSSPLDRKYCVCFVHLYLICLLRREKGVCVFNGTNPALKRTSVPTPERRLGRTGLLHCTFKASEYHQSSTEKAERSMVSRPVNPFSAATSNACEGFLSNSQPGGKNKKKTHRLQKQWQTRDSYWLVNLEIPQQSVVSNTFEISFSQISKKCFLAELDHSKIRRNQQENLFELSGNHHFLWCTEKDMFYSGT